MTLAHSPSSVQEFLEGDFSYFSQVYERILREYHDDEESPFVYNRINNLDGSFMLLLSALSVNDPSIEEKLIRIPIELDRLYSLLQLQGAYDSNLFQEASYR